MELRAPDLSAQASSAIERAIRAPADKPIEMQGLVTTDLPAAADYPYGWIFDITAGVPKFSSGANWLTFSASVVTNTPAGNISATTVQAAINELDTEKGGLALANVWSGRNTYSGGARITGGTPPSSGSGLELQYGSGIGFVTASNRSTSAMLEMRFEADPYRFYVSGSNQALILNGGNGAYFPTAGTTASPPNAYLDAGNLNNLLRSTYTFGSAAQKNTGTSGNNVPLLDGTNTWSSAQTIPQVLFNVTGADHVQLLNGATSRGYINANSVNCFESKDSGGTVQFSVSQAGLATLASGQLKFPVTQNASLDANTLDDYEEGSFTPLLKFGGGATGMTFFNQNGRYQKVGNRVHVEILLGLNAKGASTGPAEISGLPFTASSTVTQGCGAFYATGLTTVAMPMARIVQGTSIVSLYDFQVGNAVALTDADFQSGSTGISLSISYFV